MELIATWVWILASSLILRPGLPYDTVEIEEESQGYRLIIHQIDSSKRNKLNPCSKLPGQIRREQFISICADIWRRHLDVIRKESKITKEENFNDNS